MKFKLLVILLVFHSSAEASVPAGPSTGGGGFVVVCPATPLEPASAQLLDLYQGPGLGLVMAKASGNLEQDYFDGVDRTYTYQGAPDLAEDRRVEISENLSAFFLSAKMVGSAAELPQAHDFGKLPWIPSQCQLQQVAFFDDITETIVILKPLFERLSSVEQAALVSHELLYRDLRNLKDATSELTRLTVAHIYAVRGVVPLLDGLRADVSRSFHTRPVGQGLSAADGVSSLFVTPMTGIREISRLQFTQLLGRPQLTKTWVDIPRLPVNLKMGLAKGSGHYVCLVQDAISLSFTSEIQGSSSVGLTLRVSYSQGNPIQLTLLNHGVTLSEGYLSGGPNCDGDAIK